MTTSEQTESESEKKQYMHATVGNAIQQFAIVQTLCTK